MVLFKIVFILSLFTNLSKVFECVEIEGIQLIGKKNSNGVTSYYNIRYGVANRFQPPKMLRITEAAIMDEDRANRMPKSYDLSVNKGSSCPQDCSSTQQTNQKTFLCRGTEPETQSESCLTLNIYTQNTQIDELLNQFATVTKHVTNTNNNTQFGGVVLSSMNNSIINNINKQKPHISSVVHTTMVQLKPVYVFIHGGLYLLGSSSSELYNGEKLAESGAVIVTINYRLGIFGWLRAKNLSNGNMGFLDQRIALKWIKKYIEYFGGDPNKITLSGHSAGAKSVLCHSITPESNKYFSGVILHSGALSQNETSLSDAESMAEQAENIATNKCLATILSCTTKQLIEIQMEVRAQIVRSNPTKALHSWSPIVDGKIIKDSCRNLALNGGIPKDMNVIISTTNSEGVQFFRSFISYLPSISRNLATSNIAFRYIVSRIFGPKAGDAMRIYTSSLFSNNNQQVRSNSDDKEQAYIFKDNNLVKDDDGDVYNSDIKVRNDSKDSLIEIDGGISNKANDTSQFVSSSGFNLLSVGRNKDEDKWNSIADEPVALAYARMIGDFLYSCPARMFVKRISKYNSNVFGYIVNSGHRWTEELRKGNEVTGNSFINDILQVPKFSFRNSPKGIICQSDDVGCKTFVYDCSDTRLVCHMEDLIWLFQTSPNKQNEGESRALSTENSFASKFFSHLISRSTGDFNNDSNKQILKKSVGILGEISPDVVYWNSYFEGGKFLKIEDVDAELVPDFKFDECELWEWRNPDLSMNFHQLIDSKTIPQEKLNAEIEELTALINAEDIEGRNLKLNTEEITDLGSKNESHLSKLMSMVKNNTNGITDAL
ncbi:hypothetical protein RS030_162440 [Cryptosporidium xiaoi]|uniref:Carboxylesterase type B domain-containing protein n=1 Tax=Cryptosporidium xiaoi TaxID=659607 RepID=A0AAV9Y1A5_9CRYT